MIHFEDIWEEAESLAQGSASLHFARLKDLIRTFEYEVSPETMGQILFELAAISKATNINVAAAMKLAIDEFKIENFD